MCDSSINLVEETVGVAYQMDLSSILKFFAFFFCKTQLLALVDKKYSGNNFSVVYLVIFFSFSG